MVTCFNHFSSMKIIYIIYVLVVLTYTTSSLSNDEECVALFEFKQSILYQEPEDAHGFQKFNSWGKITSSTSDDNGSDCCFWEGVACNNKGHVIGLDLSQSFLRGRMNSSNSLFNLVHLQKLNLSMNDFGGSQIPSNIARLKQLRSLDLSNSRFSGQIPNEISHLVQLSSLDLSGNALTLHSPSLEYLSQNLTVLEELHLSGVDISSSVPRFLSNISSLRSIKLKDCQLRDIFPSEIFQLPMLKYLNMGNNSNLIGSLSELRNTTLLEYLDLFSTGFGGFLPESIDKLNHLVFLRLDECQFSGDIPGSLSNLTELTLLGLSQNQLTGVVPSLVSLSKLVVLSLSANNFKKGGAYDWIGKLTNLKELYLNSMNIYDEILPSFANLTKLSLVAMAENFIFGRIPSSFMNLTQLRVIDLGGNQLQGSISGDFSNFKNIQFLYLDFNKFKGRVDLHTFVGLNKLEELNLNSNKISFVTTNNYTDGILPELKYLGLSSCNLTEFPSFLRFQKKITGLFLYDNKIKGLVPKWVWNNSKETLQLLDLSYNFITGFHQHPRFLPWVRLQAFIIPYNQLQGQIPIPPYTTIFYDVSNNHLIGEIPPFICQVKSLQILDLSSNKMTGILPSCLNNLSNSLFVLDLKQNQFHGTMMNTFTHGNMLIRIDLSENRFTGHLPKSLINCTNLEVLSLGDNSFDDVFPFWLGSLVELQVLILRSNKFHGALQTPPIVTSQFSKLRILDLSNNGFSGPLPEKYFQCWNAMKSAYVGESYAMTLYTDFNGLQKDYEYSMTLTNKGVKTEYERILSIFSAIDLSGNNFEGHIPQALQDLQGLQSVNLSNNHLTGRLLPSLGNLTNLESLDLSQNELLGEIPQELLQLGFLAILNVSFNRLDGPIPQGKQFYTFQNNSYMGNPELCGEPLTKVCQNSKVSTLAPINIKAESGSLLPHDRTDWVIIFSGVVSGLVIGIVFGNSLSSRYSYWFIERFGMRKDRWVRPLRNTKRNTSTN